MIIFHDQKTLSLNFKSSRWQIFFKIGVLVEEINKKENPPQVFSCKYCEIFKNSCFEEYLGTAASSLIITNHKVGN